MSSPLSNRSAELGAHLAGNLVGEHFVGAGLHSVENLTDNVDG
jgi:hypothetical protein